MPSSYDLVVVGTGSGGAPAASKCAAGGWSVAIIDEKPYGGTCALRGCDPKKVLVGAADLTDWSSRMTGHGVTSAPRIDWPKLMGFKRTFTGSVPASREEHFHEQGMTTYHGPVRFLGEDAVEVEGQVLHFEHLLLANGAKPAPLSIEGEEHLTTSTKFLEMDALPERIAFVGGGYISFEFAHVMARAGAEATILHRGARSLESFEPELAAVLTEHTRALGIDVWERTEVSGIEKTGSVLRVRTKTQGGHARVEADLVVHGAGRVPAIDEMNLEAGGVAYSDAGVTVNEHLRSKSNPRVWAAGDVAATEGMPLTPVASMESLTVASNLRAEEEESLRTPNYDGVPTVVFTVPPLASVGLTEAEADEQELDVAVHYEPDVTDWYSYRRVRAKAAGFKVLVERETDRIVGAHVLGDGAEQTINLFGAAVRHGITASKLRHGVYAYPTHDSDIPHML